MQLSQNQIKIVKAPEEKVVVISSAASGKTECLTQRAKHLLNKGYNPERMVLITFTNHAAEEMRDRIGYLGAGMFIGTIHSYANRLLMDYGIDTFGKINEGDFDGLFSMIKHNPAAIKAVDYLLLDEAQDMNESQFEFIFDMVNPLGFFVVGDYRQSIYQFNGGRPDLFCGLTAKEGVKAYALNENYRNGKVILDYASWILSEVANDKSTSGIYYSDNSISKATNYGRKVRINYDINEIVSIIRNNDTYGDWFVLTRSNEQLATIERELIAHNIPCESFKQADLDKAQLNAKMNSNTVKVLTIHSSKGLEAKNVMVIGAKLHSEEECRISYVAVTRAKDKLYLVSGDKPRNRRKAKTNNFTKNVTNWE